MLEWFWMLLYGFNWPDDKVSIGRYKWPPQHPEFCSHYKVPRGMGTVSGILTGMGPLPV